LVSFEDERIDRHGGVRSGDLVDYLEQSGLRGCFGLLVH
jgi:hypothetical protein